MRIHMGIIVVLVFLISVVVMGANEKCDEEWNKTYGSEDIERAEDFIDTGDGFLLTGYRKCKDKDFEGWVVKVDTQGNELWNRTYGGKKEDILHCVLASDDGYLLVGYSLSWGGSKAGFWLISIDEQGNECWNKTYVSDATEYANAAVKADNGYLLAGIRHSSTGRSIWVLKTDKEGTEIWNRTYRAGDDCSCIKRTSDGYLLGGDLSVNGCLIKITEEGDMDWVRIYSDVAGISDIVIGEDGYLLLGNYPLSLIKTDIQGNEVWTRSYGGENWGRALISTDDGYAIAGGTDRYGVDPPDAWLFRVDKEGTAYWNKSFGGRGPEFAQDIIQVDDGFLILGNIQDGWDAWLIKCGNYPPPTIMITRPRENYLYLFDREICPTMQTTLFGGITIVGEVDDMGVGIDRVEFFMYRRGWVKQEIETTVHNLPYEWYLDSVTLGEYVLNTGAYYGNAGGVCTDKIIFSMFNL